MQRLRVPCAGLLVAAVSGACSAPAPPTTTATAGSPIPVEQTATADGTHYSAGYDGCRIRWELRTVEPRVILHRSTCDRPLAEQAPLLIALWRALRPAGEMTLFWGRLCPDRGCAERQLSLRLALAAHAAPDWNVRAGRPSSGHDNQWVLGTLDAAGWLPELRAAFRQHGITVRTGGVEKVLVARAGELPYWAELQRAGVVGDELLPFDCLLWLRLSDS